MGVADLLLGVDEQDLAGDGVQNETVGDRGTDIAGANDGDAGGEITGRHCLLWWVSSAAGEWEHRCNNICYSYLIIVHKYVILMYVMSGPCMQKSRLLCGFHWLCWCLGMVEFVMLPVTPVLPPGCCNPNNPPL